jgi:hypothetical protein
MTGIAIDLQPDRDGWLCGVTLTDDHGGSEHRVHVDRADLERLAPGAIDPADLVRRSFEFLLAREPRGSILREFDLMVIARYFPEFEATIRRG